METIGLGGFYFILNWHMPCQILIVNEKKKKKKTTSIKNWPHHQSVSHVYTKLTETNRMTNGARF
jgi:hypothetical protein